MATPFVNYVDTFPLKGVEEREAPSMGAEEREAETSSA